MDYDEDMYAEFQKDFAGEPRFQLLKMPDDVFFEKYYYGVEFYYKSKQYILNKYGLVHFDGPHKTADVLTETVFLQHELHQVLFLSTMIGKLIILQ